MAKFISMDVIFYASSLNYDWGGGTNYQELKKVTKWDGRQHVLVSRYALRYSILHWANKMFPDDWQLAGMDVLTGSGKNDVVRLKSKKEIKDKKKYKEFFENDVFDKYPEFDFFGFMIAESKSNQAALTRVSPVKISHAISLTPTNIDAHTMANLDMQKRAGGSGSNPVTIEEKADFYVYNITVDVDRIGKYTINEHGKEEIGDIIIDDNKAKKRIVDLVDTVLNLKRDIKGRREDLSPWLMIIGLYKDGRYETFVDKIRLDRKTHYKVTRRYKKEGDKETIENEIEEGMIPFFNIDTSGISQDNILIFYRQNFCEYAPKNKFKHLATKEGVLNAIKKFIGYKEDKKTVL